MPLNGMQGIKVREFGGLCTYTEATNIPHFMSPDCADIEFTPGLWKTRPGLTTALTSPNGDKINYLKTFILQNGNVRTLWLDSDGNLFYEDVTGNPGVVVPITDATMIPGCFGNSVTLFGREYIAFPQGSFGSDIPRAYDGTNTDRVSQDGPGACFSVTEEPTYATAASPSGLMQTNASGAVIVASPNGATQAGNIVTIKLTGTGANNVSSATKIGDTVNVSGVGVGAYNGTWPVLTIAPDFKSFTYFNPTSGLAASGGGLVKQSLYNVILTTASVLSNNFLPVNGPGLVSSGAQMTISGAGVGGYNGTWGIRVFVASLPAVFVVNIPGQFALAASGSATMAIVGNIQAGVHEIAFSFVTRNGYITKPSPRGKFTATGGKRIIATNIYTGPPNIASRILEFTPFSSENFFYIPQNVPQTNSTIIIDNTTTTAYLDFTDVQLLDGTNCDNLFELVELAPCAGVIEYKNRLVWWGELNKIDDFVNLGFDGGFGLDSNGFTYPLGWMTDPTNYAGGGFSGFGQVFGTAYSISGNGVGAIRGLLTQNAYQDVDGVQILQQNTNYSVRVRLASLGISAFTQGMLHIEFFSASATLAGSFSVQCKTLTSQFLSYSASVLTGLATIPTDLTLRIYVDGTPDSLAVVAIDEIEFFPTNQPFLNTQVRFSKIEDPDSYDGQTSILQPAEESGQSVNCCFVLRDYLYPVKDRSLFVTQENGQTEPNEWAVDEVSSKVGTPSSRGVGLGDEWAVIGGQSGLWLFNGGILTDDRNLAKEIQPTWDAINWKYGYLLDVKVDTARKRIYVACPMGSATQNDTILTLDYTQGFAPALESDGVGRKWAIWRIGCNSQNQVLRQNGALQFYIGSNAASGKIFLLDESALSDDGAAINGYWQSGYFQDAERLNYSYISANVVGSGVAQITLKKGDQGWVKQIRGWFLSTLGFKNVERQIQQQGYRMAIRFETNAAGSWMSMQGFTLYVSPAIWAPVAGVNA